MLVQDNDPKHKSTKTMKELTDMGLGKYLVRWPAESPDLNVIELVWHQLKTYTRAAPPTPGHIKKVLPKVLKCLEKATGH